MKSKACLCEKLMFKIPLSVYLPLPRIFNIYSEIGCYKLENIYFFMHTEKNISHKLKLVKNLGNRPKKKTSLCLGFGDHCCFAAGIAPCALFPLFWVEAEISCSKIIEWSLTH